VESPDMILLGAARAIVAYLTGAPAAISADAWTVAAITNDPNNVLITFNGPYPSDNGTAIDSVRRDRVASGSYYGPFHLVQGGALPTIGVGYTKAAAPGVPNDYRLWCENGVGFANQGPAKTVTPWVGVALPVLTSAFDTKTGTTTAQIGVTTDTATGTIYAIHSTASPLDGTVIRDSAAYSIVVTSTGAKTYDITGLTAATTYDPVWFVHESAADVFSNIIGGDGFTTDTPAVVTSITTVTAFAYDKAIFDSGAGIGLTYATVPLSGVATLVDGITPVANGTKLDIRFELRDDVSGAVISTTTAQEATVAGGAGAWAIDATLTLHADTWAWPQAHVQGSTAAWQTSATRCAAGHMWAAYDQSNWAVPFLQPDATGLAPNAVADEEAGQTFCVDRTTNVAARTMVTDANTVAGGGNPFPITAQVVEFFNLFAAQRPGEKLAFLASFQSGTSPFEMIAEPQTNGRKWVQEENLMDLFTRSGTAKVGLVIDMGWVAWGVSGQNAARALPIFTGKQLDGTSVTPVTGTAGPAGNTYTLTHDFREFHTFWNGTTGYTCVTFCGPPGEGLSSDQTSWNETGDTDYEAVTDNWRAVMLDTANFPEMLYCANTNDGALLGFDSSGTWTDNVHHRGYVDWGGNRLMRIGMLNLLQTLGMTSAPVPEFNRSYWDPAGAYADFWMSGFNVTTERNRMGGMGTSAYVRGWSLDGVILTTEAQITANAGGSGLSGVRITCPASYINGAEGAVIGEFNYGSYIDFGEGELPGFVDYPDDNFSNYVLDLPVADVGATGFPGPPMRWRSVGDVPNTLPGPDYFAVTTAAGPLFLDPTTFGANIAEITIHARLRWMDNTGGTILYRHTSNGTELTRDVTGTHKGKLRLKVVDNAGTALAVTTASAVIADLTTYSIVLTIDHTNSIARVFINGVEFGSGFTLTPTGSVPYLVPSTRSPGFFHSSSWPNVEVDLLQYWEGIAGSNVYVADGDVEALAAAITPTKEIGGTGANTGYYEIPWSATPSQNWNTASEEYVAPPASFEFVKAGQTITITNSTAATEDDVGNIWVNGTDPIVSWTPGTFVSGANVTDGNLWNPSCDQKFQALDNTLNANYNASYGATSPKTMTTNNDVLVLVKTQTSSVVRGNGAIEDGVVIYRTTQAPVAGDVAPPFLGWTGRTKADSTWTKVNVNYASKLAALKALLPGGNWLSSTGVEVSPYTELHDRFCRFAWLWPINGATGGDAYMGLLPRFFGESGNYGSTIGRMLDAVLVGLLCDTWSDAEKIVILKHFAYITQQTFDPITLHGTFHFQGGHYRGDGGHRLFEVPIWTVGLWLMGRLADLDRIAADAPVNQVVHFRTLSATDITEITTPHSSSAMQMMGRRRTIESVIDANTVNIYTDTTLGDPGKFSIDTAYIVRESDAHSVQITAIIGGIRANGTMGSGPTIRNGTGWLRVTAPSHGFTAGDVVTLGPSIGLTAGDAVYQIENDQNPKKFIGVPDPSYSNEQGTVMNVVFLDLLWPSGFPSYLQAMVDWTYRRTDSGDDLYNTNIHTTYQGNASTASFIAVHGATFGFA